MLPAYVIDCPFGVKVPPEFKVKFVTVSGPPVMTMAPPELIVIELTLLSDVVFVTELPLAMMISEPAGGTVPPGHGALAVVEFQLPLPAVVMVAAPAVAAIAITMTAMNIVRRCVAFIDCVFIKSDFL